jgi:hypothetical protein
MAFKKGEPRPVKAGRKKGVPNKCTLTFRATLDSLGFDVATEAVKLFATDMPIDIRLKLLDLIATYSHTKPKPVEAPIQAPTQDDTLPSDTATLLSLISPPKC